MFTKLTSSLVALFFLFAVPSQASELLNRLTFGAGYAKPSIKNVDISGRGAFQLSYHRKMEGPWSLAVGLEGGIKEYDCTICSGGKASENLTTVYVAGDYAFPQVKGLYAGPRLGTVSLQTEIPLTTGGTYIAKGSDFAFGAHAGYLYELSETWSVGGEASFVYIFTDRSAWIVAGVLTGSWSF